MKPFTQNLIIINKKHVTTASADREGWTQCRRQGVIFVPFSDFSNMSSGLFHSGRQEREHGFGELREAHCDFRNIWLLQERGD